METLALQVIMGDKPIKNSGIALSNDPVFNIYIYKKHIKLNLFITDTNGTGISVRIKEVSISEK